MQNFRLTMISALLTLITCTAACTCTAIAGKAPDINDDACPTCPTCSDTGDTETSAKLDLDIPPGLVIELEVPKACAKPCWRGQVVCDDKIIWKGKAFAYDYDVEARTVFIMDRNNNERVFTNCYATFKRLKIN